MKVQQVSIDAIKPYKNNPRKNDAAVDAVAASIEEFGFQQPIVCDMEGVVIAGHTRLKAAKKLGLDTVPVVYADLPEDKAKAYRLADNKTGELAEWDSDLLDIELSEIDMDMEPFGFDDEPGRHEWFDREEKDGVDREEGNEEYNEFLDKFEPKKTTDDCYTPDVVYNAVAEWVAAEYGMKKKDFVRPFYPGGDYQKEKYKPGAVVVDNPPFSILAEIVNFYAERGIKFFLFAPTLTLFSSSSSSSACSVCVGVAVTYENGANVNTSFLTNMENGCRLRSAPSLYRAVKDANDANLKEMHKELPKYSFPDYVITSTRCAQFSRYGIDFRVGVNESKHIRALDAQKEKDKAVFGSAYLISEAKKQEKEKAEREKAEREKAERWESRTLGTFGARNGNR